MIYDEYQKSVVDVLSSLSAQSCSNVRALNFITYVVIPLVYFPFVFSLFSWTLPARCLSAVSLKLEAALSVELPFLPADCQQVTAAHPEFFDHLMS